MQLCFGGKSGISSCLVFLPSLISIHRETQVCRIFVLETKSKKLRKINSNFIRLCDLALTFIVCASSIDTPLLHTHKKLLKMFLRYLGSVKKETLLIYSQKKKVLQQINGTATNKLNLC